MSLWADYLNECDLLSIIEEPWGFVTFSLEDDATVIHDFFIERAGRKSGRGRELLKRVEDYAREFNCDKIRAVVHRESQMKEVSLGAARACGFTVQREVGTYIIIEKTLGGE